MQSSHKANIRKDYIKKRKLLSDATQRDASQKLCSNIEMLTIYQNASHIALYQAIDGEISLTPLWEKAVAAGKTCYMPMIHPNDHRLIFLPTSPHAPQKRNTFNILEPDVSPHKAIALQDIDLMILPLVAFNQQGTRLGRGAGYYDKTLQQAKPQYLLGAAYAFQEHTALVADAWDIPLDLIVTETHVYWRNT